MPRSMLRATQSAQGDEIMGIVFLAGAFLALSVIAGIFWMVNFVIDRVLLVEEEDQ